MACHGSENWVPKLAIVIGVAPFGDIVLGYMIHDMRPSAGFRTWKKK